MPPPPPPAPDPSESRRTLDDDLLVRSGHGDTIAFARLVERHQAAVYRYCWRIFRNHHTAEDLAQELFVRLYRTAARYQPEGHFTTYLYRVLTNLCFDALRRRKRRRVTETLQIDPILSEGTELEPLAASDDLDGGLRRAEANDAVHAALAALPAHVRKAVELRELDGLSYREIARVLDLSPNEVKVILHRGRKLLSRSLARTSVGRDYAAGDPNAPGAARRDEPRGHAGLSDLAEEDAS